MAVTDEDVKQAKQDAINKKNQERMEKEVYGDEKPKRAATFKGTINYPHGGDKPRGEVLRNNIAMDRVEFPAKDSSEKELKRVRREADDYASELQRETRGKKKGGAVKMAKGGSASSRADGCAMRGKTRGRIY